MNKKIIRNARIITMNERLDILPNGNILIENGKISAITTQSLEDTDARSEEHTSELQSQR